MTDTTTLAPCPFCGDRAVSIVDDLLTFYVQCETCGTSGGPSSYRNGAVSGWNRRAPALAPTDAEIEELLKSYGMCWAERSFWQLEDADLHPAIRAILAKWGAPAPASGEVVVTCAPCGRCVAVTRQDDEGRILSVIWVEPTQDEPILRTAAQSLIDRWDTPLWKDAEHTGAFIQRLREALAAPPAQEARVPLSDEQIDRGIAELGLNYLADAHVTNRAVLRKLCHHVYGITAAQKETP